MEKIIIINFGMWCACICFEGAKKITQNKQTANRLSSEVGRRKTKRSFRKREPGVNGQT